MMVFYVKSREDRVEYFEVVGDAGGCYDIRLSRVVDGRETVLEEQLSYDLFELCLKTGYIYQAEDGAHGAAQNAAHGAAQSSVA
jgi:hypothetical protein